ncbi:ribonuclease Z [Nonomuraea coxensis DSM 45129]|uniref:Ribonuclease Z n=1 Tax=Nonomuraea coxensis DSM 45129 TaxID=1122611 RepID=A0ABX8TV30_9ACTN|nr:MBL fold metallo-hydrolase [Nonomuraea coxensis]QYC38784.1 ribonuclease Z [Nonomuraea coxensis DSM 45129]
MSRVTFLGTGNFQAAERYWNGFVLDDHILVEPSPTALPHLRRCGIDVAGLDVVAISHFHADHTFGWPFLLLELLHRHAATPLHVVGPPRVEQFLRTMMDVAGVPGIHEEAHEKLDIRYVEVDCSWQVAGPLRFRAVEVDHVAHLDCYGYVFERAGATVGYSGDTRPGAGLDALAAASDALILECNGPHHPAAGHMEVGHVEALRRRFPDVPFVLTHLGAGVEAGHIERCLVPDDFQTVEI